MAVEEGWGWHLAECRGGGSQLGRVGMLQAGGRRGGTLLTWARLAGLGGGVCCSGARRHARLTLCAWLGTQGGEAGHPLIPAPPACSAGFC